MVDHAELRPVAQGTASSFFVVPLVSKHVELYGFLRAKRHKLRETGALGGEPR